MIPVSLKLRNFLSYGEDVPALDFDRFAVACLSGANGHGKSALLDALTYALWGEARKGENAKKPDEGLLRLGAAEMRVEFCFDLGPDRYRVIRSFRRTSRSGTTQLETQLFDPEAATYRTLSSGKLRDDQRRLNELLAMDYETFINSAFLVQGRADEFTRRTATRRKEILAEILGLSRYERLEAKATERLRRHQEAQRRQQQRLDELAAELKEHPQTKKDLKEARSALEAADAELKAAGQRLDELRRQRDRADETRRRLAEAKIETERLAQAASEAEKQIAHLEGQRQTDAAILEAAEAIEADFAEYQRLNGAEISNREAANSHNKLQEELRQAESRLRDKRHEVEQRHTQWGSRCQALEEQLGHQQDLLAQEQTIRSQHELLEASRTQEKALDTQRQRHEELATLAAKAGDRIELAHQRLEERQRDHQQRQQEIAARIEAQGDLEAESTRLKQQIDELQQTAAERDRLKEEGSASKARIDQLRQQLQQGTQEQERLEQRLRLLRGDDEADCPLCGSRLDEAHRQQLDGELERQRSAERDKRREEEQQLRETEEGLAAMRRQYQELERQAQALNNLQQQSAALEERRRLTARESQEAEKAQSAANELGQQLQTAAYATEERAELERLRQEQEKLHYRADMHEQVRRTLEELAPVAADLARLEEARRQADNLGTQLADARQRRDLAQKYLDEDLYGEEERRLAQEKGKALEELGYNPEEHRRARQRLDDLSDAVARRERLNAARQRHTKAGEDLKSRRQELLQTNLRREELERSAADLRTEATSLDDIENRCRRLEEDLKGQRIRRDELLSRRGALENQCARLEQLEEERQQTSRALEASDNEVAVYAQLREAFGKNGIPALIIENAVPEIEAEANAILGRLTDNRIHVSIESLKDLKSGGTSETLDIRIADEVGERSYHLYSGGEAFRTNFALRLALSKVLAKRAGARLRLLIIDEGFGTQDSQGLEQLVEAIQAISKDFDKLLVVTHLDQLKNAFPVRIEVTKHPDTGSRFAITEGD